MIVLIDNYDSFVYNLAHDVGRLGLEYQVYRNDAIGVCDIEGLNPEAIILSPGPGRPEDTGICLDLVKELGCKIPILGVCLGHQCIAEAYGGRTIRTQPVHGKTSNIVHEESILFQHLPNLFKAARYHSLLSNTQDCKDLKITAKTQDGLIMAIEHKEYPVYGVQFHPESALTHHGHDIIENFVHLAHAWNQRKAA